MDMKKGIQKIKEFDYGKFFGSKAFLIGGCAVIIVAAIIVNALIPAPAEEKAPVQSGDGAGILGEEIFVGGTADAEGDYFAMAVLERESTRNKALAVLKEITENPDALTDAKEQAMLDVAAMVKEMNAEANIETLVKSKGFEQCVCLVSGDKASVIVCGDTALSAAQVAQITEIVYEEAAIAPENIKISVSAPTDKETATDDSAVKS